MKNKIGILTLPFGPNYGMNLQVYALQTILEKEAYNVIVINRRWNRIQSNSGIVASIKRFVYYNWICRKIYSFQKSRINLSSACYSSEDIARLCEKESIGCVIIGSDQVWRIENTRGANLDFFGGFKDYTNNTKIMSYAASFGNKVWKGSTEETASIRNFLSQFSGVSTREESGVELCKNLFSINAVCSLDPTLLLSANDYPAAKIKLKGTIVSYILDDSENKRSIIHELGKGLGINNCIELYPKRKSELEPYKYTVEEWLGYIKEASFVITDSFHGMVFSLIFEKQFLVIGNEKRGLERFNSLLNKLGLLDRIVYNADEFDFSIVKSAIKYNDVNLKLGALQQESFKYLMNAIN